MREENSISIFNSKSHLFQILRELAELNGTTSNCNGTLARIHLVRTLTLKHLATHVTVIPWNFKKKSNDKSSHGV